VGPSPSSEATRSLTWRLTAGRVTYAWTSEVNRRISCSLSHARTISELDKQAGLERVRLGARPAGNDLAWPHIWERRQAIQQLGPPATYGSAIRAGGLPRAQPPRPEDELWQGEEIIRDAATHASERIAARGLPPLPHTTPHTLRRTYISIELLANNFDVKWVMSQVGHADSKMTMDVYAQLQQRAKRDRGASFDKLVRDAREQLLALHETPRQWPIGTTKGTEGQKRAPERLRRRPATGPKHSDLQAVREWAIQDSNLGPLPYQRSALTN
jgi:hypothetical protein